MESKPTLNRLGQIEILQLPLLRVEFAIGG